MISLRGTASKNVPAAPELAGQPKLLPPVKIWPCSVNPQNSILAHSKVMF